MKKFITFLYLVAFAAFNMLPLASGVATAAPTNLIANASAETADASGPQSWLQGNWGTNATAFTFPSTGHTGTRSLRVDMSSYTNGDAKWYFAPVAIQSNTQYTFSDYYESNVTTRVVAQFDNGSGSYTYSELTAPLAASSAWAPANLTFTSPSTAKNVTIFHLLDKAGFLQTDDYSLTTPEIIPQGPSMTITSPATSATVSGAVNISGNASYSGGISKVQFVVDGVNFGAAVTTAPYQIAWDTTKLINGLHQLSAVATTTDNQTATASPISVTVSNASTVPGNVVPNPSVETPDPANAKVPQGWGKGTWGTNTTAFTYPTTGHTGTHSMKVQMSSYTNGASYWYFSPQPVVPNQIYDFKDFYMANVVTEVDAGINLSDGTTQYVYLGATYPDKTNWTKFETQFTTPSNAVSVSIYHSIYSVGWLQTDDFSLSTYVSTGFNRPIVSLTFDDGWASYYNNGLPILNKYGFKATDYIISGYLGDTDYITKAQVKNLYLAGHEIGSHTVDHPDLTSLGATKLNTELKNSQTTLQTLLGVPVTNIASPYGAYNQTVLNNIKQYYGSHRSVETGYNAKSNFDVYDIKVQNMVATTTLAQVQSWVQQAQATNTWLVLVYHQVDSRLDKTAEPYNTYQADLDAQLAYIKSTGIPVETVKQALAELQAQL